MAKAVKTIFSERFFRRFAHVFSSHAEAVAIDPSVFNQANVEIPDDRYLELWEAAGKVNPNVGLEVGSQTHAEDLGSTGHALNCATSVSKMLETLHRFIVVYSQSSWIDYSITDSQVMVEYQARYPVASHQRQDAEFAISLILHLLQVKTNQQLRPLRVDFKHDKPDDLTVHKSLFQCPVNFNQSANRIYFAPELLQLAVEQGDERLYEALEPYLERQRQARSDVDELLPRLTQIIAAEFSSGNSPLMIAVSEQLGVSSRTLQRRLKKYGVEFGNLVEEVRQELAVAYVKSSEYSITEVSVLVGYADTSSFSRAFRRWTGFSPQEYRSLKRGGS